MSKAPLRFDTKAIFWGLGVGAGVNVGLGVTGVALGMTGVELAGTVVRLGVGGVGDGVKVGGEPGSWSTLSRSLSPSVSSFIGWVFRIFTSSPSDRLPRSLSKTM